MVMKKTGQDHQNMPPFLSIMTMNSLGSIQGDQVFADHFGVSVGSRRGG